MKFTNLINHSNYSLLYGTIPIEELVIESKKKGYRAIALTDINNLYGVHQFIEKCNEHNIKPILGATLKSDNEEIIFLVKTRKGFSNLSNLITLIKKNEKKESDYNFDFDFIEEIINHNEGNVLLTDSKKIITKLKTRVKDLYAIITPLSCKILSFAEREGIPVTATGYVTFLSGDDYNLHKIIRAISEQCSISTLNDNIIADKKSILHSEEELLKIFSSYDPAVRNNIKISKMCNFSTIFQEFILPPYKQIRNSDYAKELLKRTIDGAEKRYGELSESVLERIYYELDIIKEKNFSSYFLVVGDITAKSARTCGRGSAAASIVAYSLGITNVDPIKYNLYFERFLNPDRTDPPDIDIDFAWDERDAIIDDTMKEYGRENCAMVSTHIHYRTQSALRDVARVYGIPDSDITNFGKCFFRAKDKTLSMNETWKEILAMAERLKGFPKHLSVHVGGVIITPKKLSSYGPVEIAAKNVPVITWDKDDVENAGLVKIDLLGNRSLAVIRDAISNLRVNQIEINTNEWNPQEDKKTKELVARGDTMGVFYLESPAMRQLQKKTNTGDFEHIIIHSSIIRPAANKFISQYVDRLKGKSYEPIHPILHYILKETYGIMCYQEDVSKVAIALADFSPAEADGLRKILTKKNGAMKLQSYKNQFYTNAVKKNINNSIIDRIWEMILSFDGYSFCKPHSASYAMISFQSAYLKAHHPGEFIAAVISNGGGYYTASAYISEAKRMGLEILTVDINESDIKYSGTKKTVRVGLMAIRRLHFVTMKNIVEERLKNGKFLNIKTLLQRISVAPKDLETLVKSGCLDSIANGKNRSEQLWEILLYKEVKNRVTEHSPPLFSHDETETNSEISCSTKKKMISPIDEYHSIGFLCKKHPLSLYEKKFKLKRSYFARDIPHLQGKNITLVVWPVTKKTIITSKKEPMQFVSFEDETDIFETVFFPEAYKKFSHLLEEDIPYYLTGRVENDRGALNVNVTNLVKVP